MDHLEPNRSRSNAGDAEPLIGGTLALMSYYARTRHAAAGRKIGRNLDLLSHHPGASPALRRVCERLRSEWLALIGSPASS